MGIYSLHNFLARVRKLLVFVMWNSQWAGLSCGQILGSVLFGWCCLSFSCINNRERRMGDGKVWASLCTSPWQRSLFIHYLLCWGGFSIDDFYPQSQMVLWSIAVTSHPKLWEADRTISSSPTITNTLAVHLQRVFLHAVNRNLWTAIVYQWLFDE